MNQMDEVICFAVEKHSGQTRKFSDIPYIFHPLEVASIIATMTENPDTIAAGILHDTVEDCGVEPGEIRDRFGLRVAALVQSETETKLRAACADHETERVILNLGNLEYISSAGLRVVLRLRKEKPKLRIVNVRSEVYEIFAMTGFTEMMPIEKACRVVSVEGCKVIGKGAKGTVYRYNEDTIIKVYNDTDSLPEIQRERELARRAFVLGIPTAISYDVVKMGDRFGSVFELLDAEDYTSLIREDPEQLREYVQDYALLLRQIHGTEVKAEEMPDAKNLVYKWLDAAEPYLTPEDGRRLRKLVQELPDRYTMIHGDYHTNNIMRQNGETLLIDMDTLAHGHPVIELANTHVTYVGLAEFDQENVVGFLGGMPPEVIERIWDVFLPLYLGTDDPERLRDVDRKVRLLAYTRLLRHVVRRDTESDRAKKTIARCVDIIHDLVNTLDTLNF